MELEEAHNNLRTIRLLYRLLEDNSLALQNSYSKDLVERARALLKSLLDVAVEIVFETHLKESKTPVAANNSQSSVKYPTCSKMTSEKDEQLLLKLLSKKELPEPSMLSISDDGGTKCITLSSLVEESSIMQQSSVKATNLSNNDGILPNIKSSHDKQQDNDVNALYGDGEPAEESLQMFDAKAGEKNEKNNISLLNRIHEAQSNSNAARQVEHPDQKGDFSDDLVNAIERIESRILAFQLCSNSVNSTKNSAGHHTTHEAANSDSPVIHRTNGASGNRLSSGKSHLEGHRLMNQKTCKLSCMGENSISENSFEEPSFAGSESLSQNQMEIQNHRLHTSAESAKRIDAPKQIGTHTVSGGEWLKIRNRIQNSEQNITVIDRVRSLNRLVSGDAYFGSQASECIQGLRVPLNQDDHTEKHSMLVSKTNRGSLVRKKPVAGSKTQNQKEMSSESSYAQKLAGSKSVIASREKPPLHQIVMKPTLMNQRSSEIKANSHQHRESPGLDRRRTHKTGHLEPRKTWVLPQDYKLKEPSSNFDSSCWSSQQGSANSSSDSENFSLPDGTQCPSSRRMVDAAYEGSSEESNNSYHEKYYGHSHRFGSFKSYKHHRERNPKETMGRLRRLKNKLGLVFHHHHHHHHHHHDHDHGNTHSRTGDRHTMWNQLQNVFHYKDKHGVIKKKVEKTRRGTVARVLPRRNQVRQFHRLAEEILRHVQHSKKPKPSRLDGVKQPKNSPHGHSHKKLHWWKILQRHPGVKLKNKGRVKMGFISQKSLKNY